ncbi:MAG: FecR domain-containing protein [Bacteriovoracaceae bacterium]|jgi:hypothetical protein|nr:FecR domain-containing protein [Bacteriovoracaceae bacterium]
MTKKIDIYSILIFSCLLVYSGYKFFSSSASFDFNQKGKSVAKLVSQVNTVKIRSEGQISWQNAKDDLSLFTNESLYTHDNSQAKVLFNDGSFITISPSSLIRLKNFVDKKELDIDKGDIVLSFGERKEGFDLNLKGKTVRFEGQKSKLKISQLGKQIDISLLEGREAKVLTPQKNIAITKDKKIIVADKGEFKVLDRNIILELPAHTKNIYGNKLKKINFLWISKNIKNKVFFISKDKSFKQIVKKVNLKGEQTSLSLDLATNSVYYWKVVGMDEKGRKYKSDTYYFSCLEDLAPLIEFPNAGEILSFKEESKNSNLSIRWTSDLYDTFDLQIFLEDRLLLEKKVSKKYYSFKIKKPGQYFVRIRGIANKEKLSWSPKTSFIVKKYKDFKAPGIQNSDLAKVIWLAFKGDKKNIRLKVIKESYMSSLYLEQSDTADFSGHVKKYSGNNGEFFISAEKEQTLFLRVGGLDIYNRALKKSKIMKWIFKRSSLVLKKPGQKKQIVVFSKGDEIDFNWFKHNASLSYKVFIYRDSALKQKVLELISLEDYAKFKVNEKGDYYWYVEGYDSDKQLVVRSFVYHFKIIGPSINNAINLKDLNILVKRKSTNE